ncbi:MAG: hypothetical protein MUC96_15380 [Myxococcaceae bacterium]|nr:hypothetical protein [Myxococcaceae bacterium]
MTVALLLSASPDGGLEVSDVTAALLLMKGPDGGVPRFRVSRINNGIPLVRGHALGVEKERLSSLGPLAECFDRECFEQAFKSCTPTRYEVPVFRGGCGTEPQSGPTVGWYATRRVPKKRACEVVMFAARGEQVVVDRSCRAIPLAGYDFACPDEPSVQRMVEANKRSLLPKPRRR